MKDKRNAIVPIDVQNDFCPGGALAVRDGHKVVTPLNRILNHARTNSWLKAATRDWHPANSEHFKKWVIHCVQDTHGAQFHRDLRLQNVDVFSKGMEVNEDGYDPFEAINSQGVLLGEYLGSPQDVRVFMGGLATDYCVRAGVLTALARGYETYLLTDAVRAVDVKPGDGDRAIREMIDKGARLVTSQQAIKAL